MYALSPVCMMIDESVAEQAATHRAVRHSWPVTSVVLPQVTQDIVVAEAAAAQETKVTPTVDSVSSPVQQSSEQPGRRHLARYRFPGTTVRAAETNFFHQKFSGPLVLTPPGLDWIVDITDSSYFAYEESGEQNSRSKRYLHRYGVANYSQPGGEIKLLTQMSDFPAHLHANLQTGILSPVCLSVCLRSCVSYRHASPSRSLLHSRGSMTSWAAGRVS